MNELMIGNYAIARGFVEAGLEIAAAYPGTPSSEILPGIVEFSKRENAEIHCEWSVNERVAYEVAYGAALYGKKAACMMKQVGLNVAFPAFYNFKHHEIKGSFVIVSCDDPGPQSSQTEQDTRMLCTFMDVTCFDPSSPKEAADVAYFALRLSFETKRPIVIRPTHRVSHSREAVPLYRPGKRRVRLKEGLISKGKTAKLGIVASGMSFSVAIDVLTELNLIRMIPVYKVLRVHPLDTKVKEFAQSLQKVLILEETDAVIEAKLNDSKRVYGRLNGFLSGAGELTYDVIKEAITSLCRDSGIEVQNEIDYALEDLSKTINIVPRPPKLCSGCPHRACFYAMREAFPEAIFPGDIGCYTLGIPLGAVDTVVDMGGSVSLASGFYNVFSKENRNIPILASLGDSTFFHACLPAIYDARKKNKKFILVILDNGTTAMTGMQPTPQTGITAKGEKSRSISIEATLRALGIENIRIVDPYDIPFVINTIKEAHHHLQKGEGPFAIISRRECLLLSKRRFEVKIDLEEVCTGCKRCIRYFDCPSLEFDEKEKKVKINRDLCVQCGNCLYVCPAKRKRLDSL
ncbi:MAG: thiamine pyrophosphate-dependent enzyme [Desulfobacterota bacterium]|nr:thiamine pyrophosphate-dependent enzyme [Thermodesulfobacteriota bacterium]MDW8001215.1 thiamine pyrophosphate-dependent enzyme [Deltaproteobacteria bacterium]